MEIIEDLKRAGPFTTNMDKKYLSYVLYVRDFEGLVMKGTCRFDITIFKAEAFVEKIRKLS